MSEVRRHRHYVGIPHPTLVYVLLDDKAEFDRIGLAETDHGKNDKGHVLSKSLKADGMMVVFQHWLT